MANPIIIPVSLSPYDFAEYLGLIDGTWWCIYQVDTYEFWAEDKTIEEMSIKLNEILDNNNL